MLFSHIMRHFIRNNHGKFHKAANIAAVGKPRALINHFANTVFFNGVYICAAFLKQLLYNGARVRRMTVEQISADKPVGAVGKCIARAFVHEYYPALGIAYGDGAGGHVGPLGQLFVIDIHFANIANTKLLQKQ